MKTNRLKSTLLVILSLLLFTVNGNAQKKTTTNTTPFYTFSAQDVADKTVQMSTYKGNVVVVINIASKCGLTPQLDALEALYKKYADKGLVLIGFPCNQFREQAPGTNQELADFCRLNYGVTFPLFAKIDVNGEQAHPLYNYLKTTLAGPKGGDIQWNFTKFVIDRQGNPVKRFEPKELPADMEKTIVELLENPTR